MPLLEGLSTAKINDINMLSSTIIYAAGKVIYDIGKSAAYFFMVREGTVLLDTCLEIDRYNRYPLKHDEWEVKKETKRYTYKLPECRAGQFFGHEELIYDLANRNIRAVAQTNVTVIFFKRANFLEKFPIMIR